MIKFNRTKYAHKWVQVKLRKFEWVGLITVYIKFVIIVYSFAKCYHWGEVGQMYIDMFLLFLTIPGEFTGISKTFQLKIVYYYSMPPRV